MKLLVIRHAIAMDRDEFARIGQTDDLRPLTEKGIVAMRQIANGLRSDVARLDVLASSPLVRALQTAAIVADAYGIGDVEITASLAPGADFDEFETWCQSHRKADVVAVVGHEPHLSSLVTWLLTRRRESGIELKKGGACLVEFDSLPRASSGTLIWLQTPRQLRTSGR